MFQFLSLQLTELFHGTFEHKRHIGTIVKNWSITLDLWILLKMAK